VCRSLGERGLVLIYEGLRTKVKARAVAQVGYAKPLVDRACETARTGAALLFTAAIDDSCRATGASYQEIHTPAFARAVLRAGVDETDVPRHLLAIHSQSCTVGSTAIHIVAHAIAKQLLC
jgi:hypothetical protein